MGFFVGVVSDITLSPDDTRLPAAEQVKSNSTSKSMAKSGGATASTLLEISALGTSLQARSYPSPIRETAPNTLKRRSKSAQVVGNTL
jgi:hypothetical protein